MHKDIRILALTGVYLRFCTLLLRGLFQLTPLWTRRFNIHFHNCHLTVCSLGQLAFGELVYLSDTIWNYSITYSINIIWQPIFGIVPIFFSRSTKIYVYRCNNKLRRYCWADRWRPLEVEGKLSWCYALWTSLWQYSGTIFFPRPFTTVFVLVSNWLTGVIWRSLKRTIPVINNVTPDTLPVWSAMIDSKLAPKCLKVQNRCAF